MKLLVFLFGVVGLPVLMFVGLAISFEHQIFGFLLIYSPMVIFWRFYS